MGTPGWGKNPGHEVDYSSHKVVGEALRNVFFVMSLGGKFKDTWLACFKMRPKSVNTFPRGWAPMSNTVLLVGDTADADPLEGGVTVPSRWSWAIRDSWGITTLTSSHKSGMEGKFQTE